MNQRKDMLHLMLVSRHGESWAVIEALRREHDTVQVYANGTDPWNVHDVLAHLVDAETGVQAQIRKLMAGEDAVPLDFDIHRWNRSVVRRGAEISLDELRKRLLQAYEQVLALVDELEEDDFNLRGFASLGRIRSTQELLLGVADHRLEHALDIQRAIEGDV
ncbi:MAG TPA: ClbS/DfsB family four-helix bundle protein [Anaerolineae bacterium]|nr:ClbS/DfsB family four-helix bundle protein [Anaerolineae bacterium]